MASCCKVVRRPRIAAGDTSAMYAGATTDAAPTPNPPMRRKMKNISADCDAPAPAAPTANSTAVSSISGFRPIFSAYCPASSAPMADPTNTEETDNPVPTPEEPNSWLKAATVPLMTAASKPNRNPARVATMHTKIRYPSGPPTVADRRGSATFRLVSPHERCAAVDQQAGAGDVGSVIAGQEQETSRDLLRA